MTPHQLRIIGLYRDGLSLREIAGRLNVSWQRIHAVILEQAPGILRLPSAVPARRLWRGGPRSKNERALFPAHKISRS